MPNKRSNRKIGPFDILGDKIWTGDPLFVELGNIQTSQIRSVEQVRTGTGEAILSPRNGENKVNGMGESLDGSSCKT